ncbi:MAG: hypothetical protein MJZ20_14285 [Bacteroidaceae bacterium]|nr:hypothetical protein [Bacteroidaceae bacterium]
MTELELIRKQIDACNHGNGCNSICSQSQQWMCPFLQSYTNITKCKVIDDTRQLNGEASGYIKST